VFKKEKLAEERKQREEVSIQKIFRLFFEIFPRPHNKKKWKKN
jgi:hypothetical protein